MVRMRVFISSVRRGLEEERDALPGLLAALGYTPVRFEDYTAQPLPSRQACLHGVASADVYLMLLGSHYGHRFPETGQSPTHDEWVGAQRAGIPRLVFRKTSVKFEPEQEEFARLVGDYGTGVFYATFDGFPDLAPQVVAKLRELEQAPSSLVFAALTETVQVRWCADFPENTRRRRATGIPRVEAHIIPVGGSVRTAREMDKATQGLAARLRRSGHVSDEEALIPEVSDEGSVTISLPEPQRRWDEPRPTATLGVRLDRSGQLSWWAALPGDSMGAVLDEQALAAQVTKGLRLLASLDLVQGPRVAVAVGIDDTMLLTIGSVSQLPRSGATMLRSSGEPLRLYPDESLPTAALDAGAAEVVAPLVRRLVAQAGRS